MKEDTGAMRVVTIRLTPNIINRLQRYCSRKGKKRSAVIREAIEERLRSENF